ncbi:MAG: hypothetical protein HY700_11640 [Gemmatimonadetes bacterium]|nr:hypothetical protein [Gemmatimonadota bacterium]
MPNDLDRLAELLAKIGEPVDPGATWQKVVQLAGGLEACDAPPSGGGTREWRLPDPWQPIRVPDDLFDIEPTGSEDAARRAFQSHGGDTLQLFFFPAGLPVQEMFGGGPEVPGAELEGRCARVFNDCVMVMARWNVALFGEVGWMAMMSVVARSGDSLLASVTTADPASRERLVAAVYDLAARGLASRPVPEPGASPRLSVRFHDLYGAAPVWRLERHPMETKFAEQEGRDALALYSLERIRTHWYFPDDVDPELVRIHEEEVREYAEEIVAFRVGEMEQLDRQARSTRLTFVVENAGDVPANDVRVKLTFPPHVLVGSFGTVFKPRIEPPEHPQIFQLGPGFLKRRRKRIKRTVELGDLAEEAREDGWDSYQQHPDGSLTVTYRVDAVKPHAAPNLTKTSLMFRRWEDAAPLTIEWETSVPGAPTTQGTLAVGVRSAPSPNRV